jgi:putative ABC transport system substrate-binding protein
MRSADPFRMLGEPGIAPPGRCLVPAMARFAASRSAIAMLLWVLALVVPASPTHAQSPQGMPKIGMLLERAEADPMVEAFMSGLRDLGYVEGQNIRIERRFGLGRVDRYPALIRELVDQNVDVLLVGGGVAARAARAATSTVPIVFTSVGDPVAQGLASSLSRPSGNATGLSNVVNELSGKQLELLRLAAPRLARVAVLHNPPNSAPALVLTRNAANLLKVDMRAFEVRQPSDVPHAFSSAMAWRADAILALSDPVLGNSLPQLARLAATNRIPAIYSRAAFAEAGGLLAYGPDFSSNYRRAASYVDKILKGAKPSDLPIEQPTKFELTVNVKTAKLLGLTIPPSLLQRADRIIE